MILELRGVGQGFMISHSDIEMYWERSRYSPGKWSAPLKTAHAVRVGVKRPVVVPLTRPDTQATSVIRNLSPTNGWAANFAQPHENSLRMTFFLLYSSTRSHHSVLRSMPHNHLCRRPMVQAMPPLTGWRNPRVESDAKIIRATSVGNPRERAMAFF